MVPELILVPIAVTFPLELLLVFALVVLPLFPLAHRLRCRRLREQ